MGGYLRTDDGTCVHNDCDRPVEYISVLEYGDTDLYDLCAKCYLELAHFNVTWSWNGGMDAPEGVVCAYESWEKGWTCDLKPKWMAQVMTSGGDGIDSTRAVPLCDKHYYSVMLDNVLLETGWSAYGLVK